MKRLRYMQDKYDTFLERYERGVRPYVPIFKLKEKGIENGLMQHLQEQRGKRKLKLLLLEGAAGIKCVSKVHLNRDKTVME